LKINNLEIFLFEAAKIQQFPDIPAVSAEILALRGWEGEKKRAASDCRGFRGRPPWAHYLTGGLSPCEHLLKNTSRNLVGHEP